MSDQIIGRIDDMSSRIDDLEKNIADLMTQAGVEELEGENKIATAAQKSWGPGRAPAADNSHWIQSVVFPSQEKIKLLCATNYYVSTGL